MGRANRSYEESKTVKQPCVFNVEGTVSSWRQASLCYQAEWGPSSPHQIRKHSLCLWNSPTEIFLTQLFLNLHLLIFFHISCCFLFVVITTGCTPPGNLKKIKWGKIPMLWNLIKLMIGGRILGLGWNYFLSLCKPIYWSILYGKIKNWPN